MRYMCESNLRHSALSAALLLSLLTHRLSSADESVPPADLPTYAIQRTTSKIIIDGRLEEPAWVVAPSSGSFHFTWYESGEKEQTVAKMLWDDSYLYVAHICQDAHITARHQQRDGPIPEDDCFEIMIMPNPERPDHYYNIEWNVIGGYLDGHRPEGPQGPRVQWNAVGVQIAGTFVGTVNDDSDRDRYWIAEVAIPLKNFVEVMPNMPPQPGDQWRINFNRHGGDTNMQYSQWSRADTPAPSFHTPHRFGFVTFVNDRSPF